MLPIYLSIEGFYSYQQKQEIDFKELTESGLFGIFGAVGSGKSSVLEAISFVLYGDTERLNKADKRGYNMLNLKSTQAHIVFDFINFEGKKYRFTAHWKRRPTKFEETSTIERNAYENIDGEWIPLESADASLVTNLSYPNFRRTIIIPQGQFKEFLELKGKERSDMMKEIFQLNKFDLGPKVSILQAENNNKLENMKGALSGFDMISAEILQQKEKSLHQERIKLTALKGEFDQAQIQLQLLKEAQERLLELNKKKVEIQELNEIKPKIVQQERDLIRYENTVNLFRDPLGNLQKLNQEQTALTKRVEALYEQRKELRSAIEHLQNELKKVTHDYGQLDLYRLQKEDYATLVNIRKNEEKLLVEQANLEKGQPYIVKSRIENQEITDKLARAEQQLEDYKSKRFDTTQLMDIETWYMTKDNIQQQLDANFKQTRELEEEKNQLLKVFEDQGLDSQAWEKQLEEQQNNLKLQIEQLSEEETHLQVQVRLGEFAHALTDGQPCPLCGATEHPAPMRTDQTQTELRQNQEKKQFLIQENGNLFQLSNKLSRISSNLDTKNTVLKQLQESSMIWNDKMKSHLDNFIWKEYSPEDKSLFGKQKVLNQEVELNIKETETQIKHLRRILQEKSDQLAKYENRMLSIQEQIAIAKSMIEQNTKQLRVLELSTFRNKTEQDLNDLKNATEKKITETDRLYHSITQTLHGKQTQLADVSGQYQVSKDQFSTLRENLASLRTQIAQLLEENQYTDLVEVQQILDKNLPIHQLRQEIQQFYVQLRVLERQIENLQSLNEKDHFTEEKLAFTSAVFTNKKQEYENQLSITGGLEKELAHLAVEYEKKEKLLEEFEYISRRAENLKTMENLFRGNGFVNYISTIHMERLAEIANHRFHRLTRNQLSLTVNENNEFEVIDYLNNGYKRSVKTLSGGQGFQASLCLALALAENIQALNKADKNFFFIDEGFGTQDNESINTVFDTLQYLHQENRVVGIISHVDELKERIPRSLLISKDQERGSLINKIY